MTIKGNEAQADHMVRLRSNSRGIEMREPINTDDINSIDTKKLIEAHEMVAEEIRELHEVLAEIKEILIEQKDLLGEIKTALQP